MQYTYTCVCRPFRCLARNMAEADSTTETFHSFAHTWNSAVTLSNADDINYICYICLTKDTEFNIRGKLLQAEEQNLSTFLVESKVFRLCNECNRFCHLHCYILPFTNLLMSIYLKYHYLILSMWNVKGHVLYMYSLSTQRTM